MATKIKDNTLPKRKIKGPEREDALSDRKNQIVTVTEIYQVTQIV